MAEQLGPHEGGPPSKGVQRTFERFGPKKVTRPKEQFVERFEKDGETIEQGISIAPELAREQIQKQQTVERGGQKFSVAPALRQKFLVEKQIQNASKQSTAGEFTTAEKLAQRDVQRLEERKQPIVEELTRGMSSDIARQRQGIVLEETRELGRTASEIEKAQRIIKGEDVLFNIQSGFIGDIQQSKITLDAPDTPTQVDYGRAARGLTGAFFLGAAETLTLGGARSSAQAGETVAGVTFGDVDSSVRVFTGAREAGKVAAIVGTFHAPSIISKLRAKDVTLIRTQSLEAVSGKAGSPYSETSILQTFKVGSKTKLASKDKTFDVLIRTTEKTTKYDDLFFVRGGGEARVAQRGSGSVSKFNLEFASEGFKIADYTDDVSSFFGRTVGVTFKTSKGAKNILSISEGKSFVLSRQLPQAVDIGKGKQVVSEFLRSGTGTTFSKQPATLFKEDAIGKVIQTTSKADDMFLFTGTKVKPTIVTKTIQAPAIFDTAITDATIKAEITKQVVSTSSIVKGTKVASSVITTKAAVDFPQTENILRLDSPPRQAGLTGSLIDSTYEPAVDVRGDVLTIPTFDTTTSTIADQRQITGPATITRQTPITKQFLSTGSLEIPAITTKVAQVQNTVQQQDLAQVFAPATVSTRTSFTPTEFFTPPIFASPFDSSSSYTFKPTIKPQVKAFEVFGKRYGKFTRLTAPLSKPKALTFGAKWAEKGLGATFKLVPTRAAAKDVSIRGTPPRILSQRFREFKIVKGRKVKTPLTFIEKQSFRLNLPTEIREIQEAKRKKAKKGKKEKWSWTM